MSAQPPVVGFDDPRVQRVYEILCSDEQPPSEQHWEGWTARRIVDALYAQPVSAAPSDQVIELAEALQVRRILEAIKAVAALHPAADLPTPFQAAWAACCEEIFYRATGEQWNMDEDGPQAWALRRMRAAP